MTSKPKYTPGPWTYFLLDNGEASIVHNGPLAYVGDNGNGEDNMIANARLIASAPELLAALEQLVSADNCNYDRDAMRYSGLFDSARAIIAKAKGE